VEQNRYLKGDIGVCESFCPKSDANSKWQPPSYSYRAGYPEASVNLLHVAAVFHVEQFDRTFCMILVRSLEQTAQPRKISILSC
jgi:hypothetical protein